jgi:iron-sulfur cluster assembly protein
MEAHAQTQGSSETPVVLTAKAVERFREVMRQENLSAGHGVRVAVTEGGCSGMSYGLSFDDERREGDEVFEQGGLTVFVDAKSAPHLQGVTIDWVEGLHSSGFKFLNPNATRTCGCGESFS